jgi:hypothetical protein
MTVKKISAADKFMGLSTDTKPPHARDGSTFYETDTGAMFMTANGGLTWFEKEVNSRLAWSILLGQEVSTADDI